MPRQSSEKATQAQRATRPPAGTHLGWASKANVRAINLYDYPASSPRTSQRRHNASKTSNLPTRASANAEQMLTQHNLGLAEHKTNRPRGAQVASHCPNSGGTRRNFGRTQPMLVRTHPILHKRAPSVARHKPSFIDLAESGDDDECARLRRRRRQARGHNDDEGDEDDEGHEDAGTMWTRGR